MGSDRDRNPSSADEPLARQERYSKLHDQVGGRRQVLRVTAIPCLDPKIPVGWHTVMLPPVRPLDLLNAAFSRGMNRDAK
jgi:hypothetical protein